MKEYDNAMVAAFAAALGNTKESNIKVKNLVQIIVEAERPVNIGPLINSGRKIARQYKSWAGEQIQNPKVLHNLRNNWVTFFGSLKTLEQPERIEALRELIIPIVDFDPENPDKISKKHRAYIFRLFNQNDQHLDRVSRLKGFSGASPLAFTFMGIINLADFKLENTETLCSQIQALIEKKPSKEVTLPEILESYFFNSPLQILTES